MRPDAHSLRSAALIAAGALVVHRLRYEAGYGANAAEALGRHGHGYLWIVLVASVVALCLAGAGVAHALERAARTGERERTPPPFRTLWLRASAALAGLYAVQESLEGLVAPGHAGGLGGVLGHGGWTALVFALAVGALVALLVRGTARGVARAARRAGRRTARGARPTSPPRPRPAAWSIRAPLTRHLAGRGPPLHSR